MTFFEGWKTIQIGGKNNMDKNLIRISDATDVTRGLNSLFTLVIKIDQKSRMEKLD